jgi:L-lactate dehydrogenase complex protein LldE
VVEFSAFARDVLGLAAATQATPAAASVLPTPADAVATATATAEATTAQASRPADPQAQGAAGPGGSAASAIKVALHTSCAARREMGTHVPSEALLRAMPGVELVQPLRVAECCGFGGTFSARHPAISGAMVNDKLDAVRDSGAEVLVSADCGCLLNLHHAAEKRRGQGEVLPRVVHLASFLRERQGATDAARQVTD